MTRYFVIFALTSLAVSIPPLRLPPPLQFVLLSSQAAYFPFISTFPEPESVTFSASNVTYFFTTPGNGKPKIVKGPASIPKPTLVFPFIDVAAPTAQHSIKLL